MMIQITTRECTFINRFLYGGSQDNPEVPIVKYVNIT